jgi:hypothetical protein
MKNILAISLFILMSLTVNAQYDTTKYKFYKPCPDCSDIWKTGKGGGLNSPQDNYTLRVNQMALNSKQHGSNFIRAVSGIVATVFIGTFTAILINKSNNFANNANH